MFGLNFSMQDAADRISSIRACAETLQAGLGDASMARRMEDKLRETSYWRSYRADVDDSMTLTDRGAIALRIVPKWRG